MTKYYVIRVANAPTDPIKMVVCVAEYDKYFKLEWAGCSDVNELEYRCYRVEKCIGTGYYSDIEDMVEKLREDFKYVRLVRDPRKRKGDEDDEKS